MTQLPGDFQTMISVAPDDILGETTAGLEDAMTLDQESRNRTENDKQAINVIEIPTSLGVTDIGVLSPAVETYDNGTGKDSKKEARATTVRFQPGALRESGANEGNGDARLSANLMNRFFSRNRSQVALTKVKSRLATLMVLPDKGREKGRILRTRVTADALPHARNRPVSSPFPSPTVVAASPRIKEENREDGNDRDRKSNDKDDEGIVIYTNLKENGRTAVKDGCDAVIRSESEKNERRGRSLFRGIGAHFSTSAARRSARSPGTRERESIISRIRWRRTISPSPPPRPRNRRCGRRKEIHHLDNPKDIAGGNPRVSELTS